MLSLRWTLLIGFVAAALSLGSAVVAVSDALPPATTFAVKMGLLISGVSVSGLVLLVIVQGLQRDQREAVAYLRLLGTLDAASAAAGDEFAALPRLDRNSAWKPEVERLRERLAELGGRLAETEHARTALELRARRFDTQYDRVSAVLDGISDPILVVDEYDELILANREAERLFGIDPRSTAERAVARLVACDRLVNLLAETRRRRVATVRTEDLELQGSDGESRWYRVTTTSLGSGAAGDADAGPGAGAIAVLRDVSDLKAVQRQHAEFVSAVSHEMKTPLASIRAYVELLADGDAEDEATREEFLTTIQTQADRLQRLIDNLLNLARIEAGVVQVSKQSQSLHDILGEALRVCQPAAEAKRIELVGQLSPLYLGVYADRDMLLQAVINLLSNAVKYTREGGRVTLRSHAHDAELLIEVEDTGVGLSEEDCQRVFEKFYRVERNKQLAPGTGLGLPLARHIVEDVHGGKLTVRSRLGEGSTFAITLPSFGRHAAASPAHPAKEPALT